MPPNGGEVNGAFREAADPPSEVYDMVNTAKNTVLEEGVIIIVPIEPVGDKLEDTHKVLPCNTNHHGTVHLRHLR